MNPISASPVALVRSIARNRGLIFALARREVLGRYRGSVMGLTWSFFHPLLMLAVYTFVFSVVFKVRWPGGSESKTEFALVLFAALIAFSLFSECINRAPGLIIANTNYVTKVVFPLETLPVIALLSSLFHAAVSLAVWLVFHFLVRGVPPVTVLLVPLVLLPLLVLTLGLGWLLAALGVYLRDVSQIVGVITSVLMFTTPIFYAISAVPAQYQSIMRANPLTISIEQVRDVMLWGRGPDWSEWLICLVGAVIVACLGFAWFQKTRKGFADVL